MTKRPYPVRIVAGPHAGKSGNVVSIPWIGNLWHLRLCVNVAGREWVRAWAWEVEKSP